MHIKGGVSGIDEEVWSSEGCEVEPISDTLTASFRCKCESLNDYYYALVLDRTVAVGPVCPGDPLCGPDPLRRRAPADRD